MDGLSSLISGYKKKMEVIVQRSSQVQSEVVVYATPVDTFSAINSWTPNKGQPKASNATYERGQAGPPNKAKFLAVTASLKIGDIYSLGNGKDYIRPLEHGYSGQAPSGMLHVGVAQWPAIVRAVARAA